MTTIASRGPRSRRSVLRLLVLAGLPLLAACPPEDQRTDTVDQEEVAQALSPEARAQLDSANAAYRDGEYESALAHFRSVTEMAPDDATGWFGIFMTNNALGNAEAAQEALEEARSRAPGASLIHDTVPPGPLGP